ncbi:MAG: hypothetical protein ACKO7N_02345 [Candidatus Nitrosotenuis sp.]
MIDSVKEAVYRDYLNGFTQAEIAKRHNIRQQTVSKVITKVKTTVEYRLSNIALFEFSEYFVKTKDSIEQDIAEITAEMEKTDNPDRKDKLRDQRHQRKIHLFQLIGDGMTVLYPGYLFFPSLL